MTLSKHTLYNIAEVNCRYELSTFAQKRHGRPKKTWDEVLVDDRKKLLTLRTVLSGEDVLEEDLSDKPHPW